MEIDSIKNLGGVVLKNNKYEIDMCNGTIMDKLVSFSLPLMLSGILQLMFNAVDIIVVGQFTGSEALAAVGSTTALIAVFTNLFIGISLGANVLAARFYASGKNKEMSETVHTAIALAFVSGMIMAVVGLLFSRLALEIMGTPDNVIDQSTLYMRIYFLGMPFLFMYNVLASVFNAMGDSRTPLFLLIFSSLLNVVLDIISVTSMGMGVDGVAIATVMAQGISVCISFGVLLHRLKGYDHTGDEVPFKRYDRHMLAVGTKIAVPTILQQSIVSIGMLLVQSVVNGFGSGALAGYSAASRIESICIVPMIATGNAVATFTAQNIGAGQKERVKKGYAASYGLIFGFAVFIAAVIALFKGPIISSFLQGDTASTAYSVGYGYLSFIGWFFALIGLKACTDAVLRGAGDVLVFTAANLVNLAIRVFAAFQFAPVWGVAAVWYAVPMGWGANYLISFIRYLSGKWMDRRVIEEK